jgi:hypothetical protein
MPTEKQLANLRPPWKPGETGNAGGRPSKRPLTDAYDSLLRQALPEPERKALKLPTGTTWAQAIALSRGRSALRSTAAATLSAKEMADRTEGKSIARISVEDRRGFEMHVVFDAPITEQTARNPKAFRDNAAKYAEVEALLAAQNAAIDVTPTKATEQAESRTNEEPETQKQS